VFQVSIKAILFFLSAVTGSITPLIYFQTGKWQWKFENEPVNIYYEEHEQETAENVKNILMIPTISDVSTVEEWRVVAKDIVGRKGELGYRATIVDWPGLGYSDRPSLNYNADVMESFLVQLMNSPNSPVANAGKAIFSSGGTSIGPIHSIRDTWLMNIPFSFLYTISFSFISYLHVLTVIIFQVKDVAQYSDHSVVSGQGHSFLFPGNPC
jgi:hypothetical protein